MTALFPKSLSVARMAKKAEFASRAMVILAWKTNVNHLHTNRKQLLVYIHNNQGLTVTPLTLLLTSSVCLNWQIP